MPCEVQAFEKSVTSDIENLRPQHKFTNLSRIENEALRALAADSNITIKPADKGGAIVVMNTDDYRQECLRLLGDSTYYAHIDRDPTGCLQTEIRDAVVEGALRGRGGRDPADASLAFAGHQL
ncbi:hypothetical protein NDU88_005226 [Pleurodeles waltl]|uniref:Uncharacterized protein n=1 Tax=Pleurodeles waltl TaxID=8319 RepID=A0AAV7RHW6_PLEWA|nr:hypothetical protein NDU88_005226 [Pleurodeles waltl]